MLVALSYHSGDRDSAVLLAEWIADLGGCKGHRLLLLRDRGADPISSFADSFDSVMEVVVTTDSWHRWPESANNAFRTAAKHLQFTTPEPWLWIEPDCVPLKPGWADTIEAEYKAARKPFLGARVPPFQGVPEHMSGVAVYPGRTVEYAGMSLIAYETPWDVQAAGQIRRFAHWTKLIQHRWKHPGFSSIEQVRSILDPEAVLFHASKDGSLIRLLRENLSGGTAADPEKPSLTAHRARTSLPAQKPWQSSHESIERIKSLCAELKSYCTAPRYVSIVRDELAVAGVVKEKARKNRTKRRPPKK